MVSPHAPLVDTERGDALALAALRELDAIELPSATHSQTGRVHLEHVVENLANLCQRSGLGRWRSFCEVTAAVQPLEDELFCQKKELRRAHAMLKATVQLQKR